MEFNMLLRLVGLVSLIFSHLINIQLREPYKADILKSNL